jgi:hypothetical protein
MPARKAAKKSGKKPAHMGKGKSLNSVKPLTSLNFTKPGTVYKPQDPTG